MKLWGDPARIVRMLLEHLADVNCTQKDGISPLMGALYKGRKERAKFLIEHGANLRQVTRYGQNPLNYAVCAYVHATPLPLDMLQLLLCTVGVNSHDNYGVTSLIAVCNEEDNVLTDGNPKHTVAEKDSKVFAAVQFLVTNGASLNERDINGKTAIDYAARQGLAETTRYLLVHGADPYAALQITREISSRLRRCRNTSMYRDNIRTIRILLKMAVVKEEHTTGNQNVTTKIRKLNNGSFILPREVRKLNNGSFILPREVNDAYHRLFSQDFKARVVVLFMMCKLPEKERGNVICGKRERDEDEPTRGLNFDVCSLILRGLFLRAMHEYS